MRSARPFRSRCGDSSPVPGWSLKAGRFTPYRADHGVPALGYALVEEVRLGRFDPEAARRLGVPEGPLFGKLHRGEAVVVDGREVAPADVVGPPRRGRKVVYSGDTRPSRDTVEIARGAELLIHEATFGADEVARARETRHSTSAEAARVAFRAGVQELVLTHISARHSENPARLKAGGQKVFPACRVARDGLEIEIGYRDG